MRQECEPRPVRNRVSVFRNIREVGGGLYVTTFCNFAHALKTGRPIGHECYILEPKALQAESRGEHVTNIVKEPRQIVKGRARKEAR